MTSRTSGRSFRVALPAPVHSGLASGRPSGRRPPAPLLARRHRSDGGERTATHGRFGEALSLSEQKDALGFRAVLVGEPNPFSVGAVHQLRLDESGAFQSAVVTSPEGALRFGNGVGFFGEGAVGVGATVQPNPPPTGRGLFVLAGDFAALQGGTVTELVPDDLVSGATGTARDAAVFRVGDRDGDGRSDLALFGAGLLDAGGSPLGVTVISSATFQVIERFSAPAGAEASFGASVTALPDFDGDGKPELAIAAPFHHREFPPLNDGGPDPKSAPIPACTDLRGGGYSGNCAGLISLVLGTELRTLALGAKGTTIARGCLIGGAGARMGTALAPLGPHPVSGANRLAYGSPGLPDRPGYVGFFIGTVNANGVCEGELESLTVTDGNGEPVPGLLFGERIAR